MILPCLCTLLLAPALVMGLSIQFLRDELRDGEGEMALTSDPIGCLAVGVKRSMFGFKKS